MEYSVVGKRLTALDGAAKATGEAKYTADITLPRMLYGKVLRSPHPHASILSIDTTEARRLPGVKAVITANDTLGVKYGQFADETPLAVDKVRFIGEGVAAVAAIDEGTVSDALDLIRVEYEPLPAVFDLEHAMSPGAPTVHDNVPGNVSARPEFYSGDVDEGFRQCDYVREDTFRTQAQAHCALETHSAIASFDPSGKLTLWASNQGPYHLSLALAQTLGMPPGNVRVISPHVGGGFGGKREMMSLHFCASLLSGITGRPVRIVYTLEEQFIAGRHRHAFIVKIKTGVNRDGAIIAQDCTAIADGGAYNSRGPLVVSEAGSQIGSLYRVPNARYQGSHVYTNNPVGGAFRGYGRLQVRFAADAQMDMIARDLGLDPVEIRLKNAIGPNETAPCGWRITSCGFSECIERAAEAASWDAKRDHLPSGEGIGMGCNNYTSGGFRPGQPDSSAALVKVHENGTVTLFTGAADMGQGSHTTLAQIAAEELGVKLEDIRLAVADSEATPTDLGAYASRTTFMAGNAVKAAAMDAKSQILRIASETLEARAEDLAIRDRRIRVHGSPTRAVDLSTVVKAALVEQGVHILGKGYYSAHATDWDTATNRGNTSPAYSFGAHVALVKLDRETGQVALSREVAAHDCGFAVNPLALEGQIEGCVVCGMGMSLSEEILMSKGQVLNPSFEAYKLPTALEAPEVHSIWVETIDPEGPFGAKGVCEGAQVPVAPAIANALTAATGAWFRDLPMTPEKLLETLG